MPERKPKPDLENFSPSPIFGFVWRCSYSISRLIFLRLFHSIRSSPLVPTSLVSISGAHRVVVSSLASPHVATSGLGRLVHRLVQVRQSRSSSSSVVSSVAFPRTSSVPSSDVVCFLVVVISRRLPTLVVPVVSPSPVPGVPMPVRRLVFACLSFLVSSVTPSRFSSRSFL